MEPGFLPAGLLTGILIGATGVGGGAVMTPLLVSGFNVPLLSAIGTDLLYAACTKGFAVMAHAKQKTIQWRIVLWLALGSLPASWITSSMLGHFQTSLILQQMILLMLGLLLVLTSGLLLVKSKIPPRLKPEPPTELGKQKLVLLGMAVGCLVTLTSIGSGALTAVVLLLMFPMLSLGSIVGTDLAHALPLVAVAGLGHLALGQVDLYMLGWLLRGSMPGAMIGSWLAIKVPQRILLRSLSSILMLLGFDLLLLGH